MYVVIGKIVSLTCLTCVSVVVIMGKKKKRWMGVCGGVGGVKVDPVMIISPLLFAYSQNTYTGIGNI